MSTSNGTEVRFAPRWVFDADGAAATLILKALGGRLGTEEEREAARELGDALTEQRAKQAAQFADSMSLHAKRMREARI